MSVDPTLAQGEFGWELDTSRMKMGDALLPWSLLPYWATGGGVTGPAGLDGMGNFISDGFTGISNTPVLLWSTDNEALYYGETGLNNWVQVGNAGGSGYSGVGTSGYSGATGPQGISGYSGLDGQASASGYSGQSGYSGISGFSGENPGASGYSGASGTSGFSGYSGRGLSGWSGYSGTNGTIGADGASGYSGRTGLGNFIEDGYTGIVESPVLLWNTDEEALFYGSTGVNNWVQVSAGAPRGESGYSGAEGIANFLDLPSYPALTPVTLLYNENDDALFASIEGSDAWVMISAGSQQGASGYSGQSGHSGYSGQSGASGVGIRGFSGYSGFGVSGSSGYSGVSGHSGYSGYVNVVYGTGAPPPAAGYVNGTLYFQYVS